MLKTNTVSTVHQRLRDEQGLTVSLTSFRRYCWWEFPERAEDRVTVPGPPVPPGEEAQIDYGYLGSWFDPQATGATPPRRCTAGPWPTATTSERPASSSSPACTATTRFTRQGGPLRR